MALLYALIFLAAFLFFVLASLLSAALTLWVPLLLLVLFLVCLGAGRPIAAIRAAEGFLHSLGASGAYAKSLFRLVSHPLAQSDATAHDGNDHRTLPDLWKLVEEVAVASGVPMVDEIVVVQGGEMAVYDTGGIFFGTRRHLVFGLPFMYALTGDELRCVLAHEFGHYRGSHTKWIRLVSRFAQAIAPTEFVLRQSTFYYLSPFYWSTFIALATFEGLQFRWSRSMEFDADRRAAQFGGSNHLIAALLKLPEVYAIVSSLNVVEAGLGPQRPGPTHALEAAARLAAKMSAVEKHRLKRAMGNVLFHERDTHPPVEIRIAALKGLPGRSSEQSRMAVTTLPDARAFEERLTRRTFKQCTQFVPAKEFVAQLAV